VNSITLAAKSTKAATERGVITLTADREEHRPGNAPGLPCSYRVRALFNFTAIEYEGHDGRPPFPDNPVTRISHTKARYRLERRLDNSYKTSYPDSEWTFHHIGNRIEYCQVSMNASPDRHAEHVHSIYSLPRLQSVVFNGKKQHAASGSAASSPAGRGYRVRGSE